MSGRCDSMNWLEEFTCGRDKGIQPLVVVGRVQTGTTSHRRPQGQRMSS